MKIFVAHRRVIGRDEKAETGRGGGGKKRKWDVFFMFFPSQRVPPSERKDPYVSVRVRAVPCRPLRTASLPSLRWHTRAI